MRALKVAEQVGTIMEIKAAANNLYQVYKHIGNFKLALKMHELYITMNDSVENIATQKNIIRQEFKYKYEKQALTDSLTFVKEQKVNTLIYQNKLDKERYILVAGFVFLLILLGVFLRIRRIKTQTEKNELLQQIKLLKVEHITNVSSIASAEQLQLNKTKIETIIGTPLNQSDWKILTALYNNPVISNKEIAEEVSLSLEGVRSSLQKMYRLFNIKTARNQRIALVMEATKLSKG